MPDILIRGMEMPSKGYKTVILHSNGSVYEPTSNELILNKIADATGLPPHGDLIDRDAFREENEYYLHREFINPKYEDTLEDLLNDAPVVPADKEETE